MSQNKKGDRFTLVNQLEQQISIIVPSLYHNKVRATIFQTLLLMRDTVEDVEIEIDKNIVTISYDSVMLPKEDLFKIIERVLDNFSHKPHSEIKKGSQQNKKEGLWQDTVFGVDGMSCDSCALFVEMVLSREPNVLQATIDYNQKKGVVRSYLSQEEIFKIIEKNGYLAYPIG